MAVTRNGNAGRPGRQRPGISVHDPDSHSVSPPRGILDALPDHAIHRPAPVVRVNCGDDVDVGATTPGRLDHEHAEESAAYLLVRNLVRVIPVRASVLGDESVDVFARRSGRRPG